MMSKYICSDFHNFINTSGFLLQEGHRVDHKTEYPSAGHFLFTFSSLRRHWQVHRDPMECVLLLITAKGKTWLY